VTVAFFRKLQEVTTKIHATANLDEIMLDLGLDFCDLFDSDRFTLYAVTPEKDSIVSRVKTGLSSFRDLRLPIGTGSVAGFVAASRQTVNIADVYDDAELRRLSPELQFQRGVDQRTGYRTREMLVAPLVSRHDELLGVVQFINHQERQALPAGVHGGREAAVRNPVGGARPAPAAAAPARQVRRPGAGSGAVGRRAGAGHAHRARARLRHRDRAAGRVRRAPAGDRPGPVQLFRRALRPFHQDRIKPVELLRNLKQQYVEENGWLPLEDGKDGLVVMALDPERVASSRIVAQVFQRARVVPARDHPPRPAPVDRPVVQQRQRRRSRRQRLGRRTAVPPRRRRRGVR
jgi:hypothetical protein